LPSTLFQPAPIHMLGEGLAGTVQGVPCPNAGALNTTNGKRLFSKNLIINSQP